MLALAFLAGMADLPFQAALNASLPLLSGERYLATLTLWTTTRQAMSLVGFAVGGLLVAATSPSAALALNGATTASSSCPRPRSPSRPCWASAWRA